MTICATISPARASDQVILAHSQRRLWFGARAHRTSAETTWWPPAFPHPMAIIADLSTWADGLTASAEPEELTASSLLWSSAMGRERQPIQVTIVAARAETLDGLQTYLSLAGVGARGTRRLGDVDPEPCSAIVLFPDEFSQDDVLRELSRLRRDRPGILPLLVTREPECYGNIAEAEGDGHAPIVIPKPAWGWTILDAIRSAW